MLDLKSVVVQYPKALESRELLKAHLDDLFPDEDRRIIEAIINLYDNGIVEQIRKNKGISLNQLEEYSKKCCIPISLCEKCVTIWQNALLQGKNENQKVNNYREQYKAKKIKKARTKEKIIKFIRASACICLCVGIIFSIISIVKFCLNKKYMEAIELYKNGNYTHAISIFESLNGYKDSETLIDECNAILREMKYNDALQLYNNGRYEEAISKFEELNGYKDSTTQIEKCNTAIMNVKYNDAVQLYYNGKYEESIEKFEELNGYKDSADQIEKCNTAILELKYINARELYNKGKYDEAISILYELGKYKDSDEKISKIKSIKKLMSANVDDTVEFGTYKQSYYGSDKDNIKWIVLAKQSNKMLLLSGYALERQPYNTTKTDVTWENCTLRAWLNSTFLNEAFSEEEQKQILVTTVSASKNTSYNTKPGNATKDKIFLLSIDEVSKYLNSGNVSNGRKRCEMTHFASRQSNIFDGMQKSWGEYTCRWWLRTPGSEQCKAATVGGIAYISYEGEEVDNPLTIVCVRPAMWISLDFDIF